MSTAISLHLGLNRVDPAHYGTEARLLGCINDAMAMETIAKSRGFETTIWFDDQATTASVRTFLTDAGRKLISGDTLLVTISAHGALVPDQNNDEKPNTADQTWCLFDRMIVDDELAEIWATFLPGVRIILISDTCHSASIARTFEILRDVPAGARGEIFTRSASHLPPLIDETVRGMRVRSYRALPLEASLHVNGAHRELYSNIQQQTRGSEQVTIAATVLTLSACLDEELAWDGDTNGFYTSQLLAVWNDGAFQGTYRAFQDQIATAVGTRQTPQYTIIGGPNPPLEAEQPFTVAGFVRSGRPAVPSKPSQPSADPSINERLALLKRPDSNGGNGSNACRFELVVPRNYFDGLSEEEALRFLSTDGADTLMKALLHARQKDSQRSSIEHDGKVKCKGAVEMG
jgi:hypothetical protein